MPIDPLIKKIIYCFLIFGISFIIFMFLALYLLKDRPDLTLTHMIWACVIIFVVVIIGILLLSIPDIKKLKAKHKDTELEVEK